MTFKGIKYSQYSDSRALTGQLDIIPCQLDSLHSFLLSLCLNTTRMNENFVQDDLQRATILITVLCLLVAD